MRELGSNRYQRARGRNYDLDIIVRLTVFLSFKL